jgi:cytochrome c-type biogenesis protein CcmF
MATLGSLALWLCLPAAIGAAAASWASARRPDARLRRRAHMALAAVLALATVAALSLFATLLSRDFQVAYVYHYTSTNLPFLYTLSAFWAGQEGSFLLWFWLVAVLGLGVISTQPVSSKRWPHLVTSLAVIEAWFALILVLIHDPFQTFPVRPPEGLGMSPLLENPGMVIHPPVLFLGYATYTVPFVFALASLIAREEPGQWVRACRRWSVLAWLALTAGILIGGWWSYVELGWGGYWAWDPVENASLIPWLLGTSLLHSSIAEERRGLQRVWNVWLAALAFAACLFATLVTRGGVIASDLHGFATDPQPIAYFLAAAIALCLAVTGVISYVRRANLSEDHELDSLLSREGSFFLTNLLFGGAALLVLLGTVFPALSQALRGVAISLSASYYQRAAGPLLVAIVALMGVCPTLAWQKASSHTSRHLLISAAVAVVAVALALVVGVTQLLPLSAVAICAFDLASAVMVVATDAASRMAATGESIALALLHLVRSTPRRYGAYVVHVAIVIIALGITGSMAYKSEQLIALRPGGSAQLRDYTIRYDDYVIETLNADPVTYQSKVRYATILSVHRGTNRVAQLVAERNDHWALSNPWVTEVAIYSTFTEDLYVVLASLDKSGLASFHLAVNPLVSWIWAGGIVLLVGAIMVAWPRGSAATQD